MGTFFHPITLIAASGQRVTIDALVDTGATFTSVPQQILSELGVVPVRQVSLKMADGSSHAQSLGELRVEVDDLPVTTLVVFGEAGSPPAIGAITLESLLLGVDPVAQRLVPVEGWQATDA